MDVYDFAEKLMDMEGEIWEDLGLNCRPSGEDFRKYLETALAALEENGISPDDVTDGVMDILENENFHSLTEALDIYCSDDPDQALEDAMEREMSRGW